MTIAESTLFDALMSRGLAASQANDSTQAIECFLKASAARPSAGLPQFMLGSEFAALGLMDKAEAAFANAARLAPDFTMARYQLGLLQFSAGRAALALLTWEPLLRLPDTDPLPHFVRGFDALARDRFDPAISHYQRGLALNTANDALSDDIEKMIAGIRAMATHAPAASSGPVETSESDAHVLLANYQQQGRAH
jgi:tetratricopeptide (TPR) repeat protein